MAAITIQPISTTLVAPIRLILDGSSLKLTKFGGRYVFNPLTGEQADINTEPTLATSGLSANTIYNVYFDSGTGALSASATASNQTWGIDHITSDTGRLLVGVARTNASTAWVDSVTQRLVCSLFNPQEATMTVSGADQTGITADNNWQTPSTDMLLSYIRHPMRCVQFQAQCNLFHNDAIRWSRVGIDVGLTGTPQIYQHKVRTSGSSSYLTAHTVFGTSSPGGSFAYEQSRVRIAADNSGSPDLIDIIHSPANVFTATLWR